MSMKGITTGADILSVLEEGVKWAELLWEKLVFLPIDGAPSKVRHKNGLVRCAGHSLQH